MQFCKVKNVPNGLIVVEKIWLEVALFFFALSGTMFESCGPKTRDANSDKQKGGHPF